MATLKPAFMLKGLSFLNRRVLTMTAESRIPPGIRETFPIIPCSISLIGGLLSYTNREGVKNPAYYGPPEPSALRKNRKK